MGFCLVWSLLLVRVFILQVFPHQKLERLESKQYETTVKVDGRRGSIFDRNGVELAISAPTYSLFADPQELWPKRKEAAKKLQRVLGLDPKKMLSATKDKRRRFVWLDRQLTIEKMEKINGLKIHGLGFIEEPKRVYPDEDILKPILGVVGRSGKGAEGIEKQYDSTLRSDPRKIQVRRDARGRPLHFNGLLVTEMESGSDVELTIDRELQYVLHRELKQTVEEQGAAGAVGIVLDAKTSEVLAMDGVGIPMGEEKLDQENWRNRPIIEAFEPGSTMKTFIIAAGLQKKNWQPNTKFNCEKGEFRIGNRVIGEADTHHRFGWLTISEILAVSSNIGVTKMAFSLGEDLVKESLSKFGFGRKTGIDLPGEAKGIVQSGKWNKHLLSNVSFGHGMTATPLQIANAYAAIANGGILRVPTITKKQPMPIKTWDIPWLSKSGHEKSDGERVLSTTEAQTLRLLLAGVMVPGGTGYSASVPGYPVAGKTGTAQKVNPHGRGYLAGSYISSFIGMIPANDPKFVIYVAVDSPKKQYYGSQVAGPLFSRVATYAVRHEGIAPRWLNEQQAMGLLPNLVTKNEDEKIKDTEIQVEEAMSTAPSSEAMPNIGNLTVREVQEYLRDRELRVRFHGSGKVMRFEPQEGTILKSNDKVEVWLTQ
jgi:cell division protein FtsI (penicillin-binding protein 3)